MVDEFKAVFKIYKRKIPPPDFSEVIDAKIPRRQREKIEEKSFAELIDKSGGGTLEASVYHQLGLKPPSQWKIYSVLNHPGFLLISNPFTSVAQRYWIKRCIEDYPSSDNVTNLGPSGEISTGLWIRHQEHLRLPKDQRNKKSQLEQLRWITLGYHYDWTEKVYRADNFTLFPDDLRVMSSVIAATVGYPSFDPQTAIVNIYNMDSTLGGHNDHSELDHNAPLVSFSFGQSAVFLIGGATKSIKPDAIFLHSGDIIVMAGQSRLAYHAVPKIVRDDLEILIQSSGDINNEDSQKKSEARVPSYEGISDDVKEQMNPCFKDGNDVTEDIQVYLPKDEHLPKDEQNSNIYKRDLNHGLVPCTLSNNRKEFLQKCNEVGHEMNRVWAYLKNEHIWKPFMDFMLGARLNISVRQVTSPGKSFDTVS